MFEPEVFREQMYCRPIGESTCDIVETFRRPSQSFGDRLRSRRFAGYRVDGRTLRKQVHRDESRKEYYWELRSKNAQNIKALVCPL